ncbi:MAG: ATPase, T2SS/T4P/T4SS family, partial [Eubacteriales bacterium]|nr:ATPase, T2SS/T4P/T4SS family [Eubacteriales bacterium]
GYRINGILQNVALNGPALTIRKFSDRMITMEDLVELGSMTELCKEDLCALTECGYNIFISGGTSSGKTTLLNALAEHIHSEERVVIIEDSAELNLSHLKNRVQLECRSANSIGKGAVTMDQLIRTSLRMRPDRIIVGEVRGGEVLDMIQAMNTGHSGSISTGHGNSIRGMLNRLETMYMMSANVPVYSVRNQIANAIEIFIHLQRDGNGIRKVVEVAEIEGVDGEKYRMNYLYRTDAEDKLIRTENHLKHRGNLRRGGYDDRL